MTSQCYRIDVGRWTLSRCNGHSHIEFEPDPLVFEPNEIADTAEDIEDPVDRAALFRKLLQTGEVSTRAELARRYGISRARVTQILGPARKTK